MFDDFAMVSVVCLSRDQALRTLQNSKHLRKHIRCLNATVGCAMLACDQLKQLQQPILTYVRSHLCLENFSCYENRYSLPRMHVFPQLRICIDKYHLRECPCNDS